MKKFILFSILSILLLSSCATAPTPAECPTIMIATACPFMPTPTLAPTAIPFANSLAPYKAQSVKVAVDKLNLRTGPGMTFPVITTYASNIELWVYAKEPGDGWLFVRYTGNTYGWVDVRFVTPILDLREIPAINPSGVQVVSGRLLDMNGKPAQYVQFAVTQGSGTNPPRTDAQTNADGWFYAYLPTSEAGTWDVQFVGYGCGYAFVGTCNRNGTVAPESQTVTLPQASPLQFIWDGN